MSKAKILMWTKKKRRYSDIAWSIKRTILEFPIDQLYGINKKKKHNLLINVWSFVAIYIVLQIVYKRLLFAVSVAIDGCRCWVPSPRTMSKVYTRKRHRKKKYSSIVYFNNIHFLFLLFIKYYIRMIISISFASIS